MWSRGECEIVVVGLSCGSRGVECYVAGGIIVMIFVDLAEVYLSARGLAGS